MTAERIAELLAIEHECMLRSSHGVCNRMCEDCGLVQDDDELHEMYTDAIFLIRKQIPVAPTWKQGKAYCGDCGKRIIIKKIGARYCYKCGRKVSWYETAQHRISVQNGTVG